MRPPRLTLPRTDLAFLPFQGGLDLETPPWQVRPGFLRDCLNYEVGIHGGYQDIAGYERFDGRPPPSEQVYHILGVTITGSIGVGDVITGNDSSATGKVIRVVDETHEDYEDEVYVVLARVTGTFDANETLSVSAVDQGIADSTNRPSGARTPKLHAIYLALAANEHREDIQEVPGEGRVWGVFPLNGKWYAIRDKVGGTTAGMYVADDVAGWDEVDLGHKLRFYSGGTYEVKVGDTLTGGTSGATAEVKRIILQDGEWSGGDAEGYFVVADVQDGPFSANEELSVGANSNVANTAISNHFDAIELAAGGLLDWDRSDIFSAGQGERVYGAYGTGPGFEFDGEVMVPIDTGMDVDTPSHVIVHQGHLFFSFGSSVQHSSLGDPYTWSANLGAGEINVGSPVTGFQTEPGEFETGALSIFSQNRIHILYGAGANDWFLVPYREEVGAFRGTIRQLAQTIFLHERGVTGLRTVEAFGNFAHNTYTNHIQSWMVGRLPLAIASCVVRNKSQYRVFFSDGWALYMTMSGTKLVGVTPIKLDHPVICIANEEKSDGTEEIMFGSTDGFVYQLDKGTSFDGEPIQAFMELHFFYPNGSIGWVKRWMLASLEVRGESYAEFQFAAALSYGNSVESIQPRPAVRSVDFSGERWGQFIWDQFIWDAKQLNPSRTQLSGESENISIVIRKSSDYMQPVRFSGATLRYVMRPRQIRS